MFTSIRYGGASMKYRRVGLLSIGHLVTDINQGALPAMLPFFIAAYDLSYAAAAGIVFAANMTSTIVQPLFGHVADRFSKPWLLSVGLILAGVGLALSGVVHSYRLIMVFAMLSGIGIAAYHPEAARLVNFSAGTKKGTAMSIFGVGGTIGFAIGPLIVTAALLQWGLNGTLVLMVPVAIMTIVMTSQFSTFESLEPRSNVNRSESGSEVFKEDWAAFARLTITVIGRSVIFYGLNTFIPIYWINGLNQSKAAGAMALTIFAGSGILGNLLGGSLADRLGQRKIMLFGFLGLTLFLPVLALVKSAGIATLLLIPIGLTLYASYSPTIVLGQSYLPNRIGLSSGVTLGVAVAIGGGAAPVIGKIADLYGIWFALVSISCLPIFTSAIALSLPRSQKIIGKIDDEKPLTMVQNA